MAVTIDHLENGLLSDENYESLLNSGTGIMGNIEIPKISVNLPIYHGTSEEVLSNGIGHLQGTSLPIGGMNTRSVLTGHRGLPNAKLFTRLDEMEKGDLFYLNIFGKTLAYQVNKIEIIEPEDMESLGIAEGKDLVSLVTCTPYGLNTHRLIVTGERIEYEKQVKERIKPELFSVREFFFMALPFLMILIQIIVYLINRKKRCKSEHE